MRCAIHVSSRALPGRDADYNLWYDTIHVHDVLALPGFLSCERFVREPVTQGDQAEYLAIYQIECEDPQAQLQTLFAAAPQMQQTDAIDMTSPRFEIMQPMGTFTQS